MYDSTYTREGRKQHVYNHSLVMCTYVVHVHVVEYREQVQSRILHVHKYVHGMHICEIIPFTDELAKSALQCIIVSLSFAISFMPYILCIIYMYTYMYVLLYM